MTFCMRLSSGAVRAAPSQPSTTIESYFQPWLVSFLEAKRGPHQTTRPALRHSGTHSSLKGTVACKFLFLRKASRMSCSSGHCNAEADK
eukprot:6474895-Amphidinium_carterae.1